jgi:hypothetical protein
LIKWNSIKWPPVKLPYTFRIVTMQCVKTFIFEFRDYRKTRSVKTYVDFFSCDIYFLEISYVNTLYLIQTWILHNYDIPLTNILLSARNYFFLTENFFFLGKYSTLRPRLRAAFKFRWNTTSSETFSPTSTLAPWSYPKKVILFLCITIVGILLFLTFYNVA